MLKLCAAVLVSAVLIGCGGGGGDGTPTNTPNAEQTSFAATARPPAVQTADVETATAPTPTPGAEAATAIAAGPSVELVPFSDPVGRYTVAVPRGWKQEDMGDYMAWSSPGPLTNLGIFCGQGMTAAELRAQDERVIQNIAEREPAGPAEPLTVAGREGVRVKSRTILVTTVFNNTSVYFEGSGCAWRIQLTTVLTDDYAALIERVLASFALT